MQCPICDSEKIMSNLPIRDHQGLRLFVYVEEKPDALLFKRVHKGELHANACGDCGYVSLSVENPKGLWQIYSERKMNIPKME